MKSRKRRPLLLTVSAHVSLCRQCHQHYMQYISTSSGYRERTCRRRPRSGLGAPEASSGCLAYPSLGRQSRHHIKRYHRERPPTWREMRHAAHDGRGDVTRRLELRHERARARHHGSHLDHWVYDWVTLGGTLYHREGALLRALCHLVLRFHMSWWHFTVRAGMARRVTHGAQQALVSASLAALGLMESARTHACGY